MQCNIIYLNHDCTCLNLADIRHIFGNLSTSHGGNGPVNCVKITGQFRQTTDGKEETAVLRGCEYGSQQDTCRDIPVLNLPGGGQIKDAKKCVCDSDGCNSAYASITIQPVFAAILFFIKFLY